MSISSRFREFLSDFRAFRRGERRIAPAGATGRVYERKNAPDEGSGTNRNASGRGTATLTMKITRADGTVETRIVPAEFHRSP